MAIANQDEEFISGINVTPLVDVVLVLLVVLMVTASYIASRAIPVDLPKSATGEATSRALAVTVDARGKLYLDAQPVDEARLQQAVKLARAQDADTRAIIAADGAVAHKHVVRVVDLLRKNGVYRFAINVQPTDAAQSE